MRPIIVPPGVVDEEWSAVWNLLSNKLAAEIKIIVF
jgi:hypothetical protein